MRRAFFYEAAALCAILMLCSFCIFDEEPVFDWTDWNLTHVWLVVLAVLVVLFELTLRARFGQYLYKDLVTLQAALSFWFMLENYTRVVILVLYVHNCTPLEADLLELVASYQALSSWLGVEVLPGALFFMAVFGVALLVNLSVSHGQSRLQVAFIFLVCVGLLLSLIVLGWDLLTGALSFVSSWAQNEVFYLQPKSSWTYDRAAYAADQFDWHRERTWPHSIRFEDLFFFIFQLLLVWALFCAACVWLYILSCASGFGGVGASFLQVAVGVCFLEHVAWGVGLAYAALGLLGLRVWLQVPAELSWLWA